MKIQTVVLGEYGTNCYIVSSNNEANEAVIVDPSGSRNSETEAKRIDALLIKNNLTPKAVLLTHGHFDHTGAAAFISEKYPDIKVYLHESDVELALDKNKSAAVVFLGHGGSIFLPPPVDAILTSDRESETIEEAGIKFEVMHTPGHTGGSVMYITETDGERVIFSGDTIFRHDVGRTDLYGGDQSAYKSTFARIRELQGEYKILPGHGAPTTMSEERRANPYM